MDGEAAEAKSQTSQSCRNFLADERALGEVGTGFGVLAGNGSHADDEEVEAPDPPARRRAEFVSSLEGFARIGWAGSDGCGDGFARASGDSTLAVVSTRGPITTSGRRTSGVDRKMKFWGR